MLFGKADKKERQIYVVLPAFNEAETIGFLCTQIDDAMREAALAYRIIIVDDGSADGMADIVTEAAKSIPITLEIHSANQGLGATIRDGLALAAKAANDNDIIVTMDADATHTPGLILRMVRMVREGHDVVIASRYQPGARVVGVPLIRRFLSYAASWLFRVVFPIPNVKDYTCGYRAYRASVVKLALLQYGTAFPEQDGFECMVDILLKLRAMDTIMGEVPFILRYDKKAGKTKMDVPKTIRRSLLLLVRRKLSI